MRAIVEFMFQGWFLNKKKMEAWELLKVLAENKLYRRKSQRMRA